MGNADPMKFDQRNESKRTATRRVLSISWKDAAGITRAAEVRSVSTSQSGVAFDCDVEIPVDTVVYISAGETFTAGYSLVRQCRRNGENYTMHLELEENACQPVVGGATGSQNLYEFLQISPAAQAGTIQRVFRYLAGLYHPDNPETGDAELFLRLTHAHNVLSNPELRAAYDAELNGKRDEPSPAFAGIDFLDGIEGELNRRLAVLAVLYRKCRSNIHEARVTLIELEVQMGFPREYLDFTTWYLRSKKYITKEDNSDFALTVQGVDFVEENYDKIPLLAKLLNAGPEPTGRKRPRETSEPIRTPKAPVILPIRSETVEPELGPDQVA